ncbi:MAG: hypothetical protein HKN85_09820, partial [Gammaproteobacteria bacterium]|nr:hypothetical protein [Gammaproteobacteria bacterium]
MNDSQFDLKSAVMRQLSLALVLLVALGSAISPVAAQMTSDNIYFVPYPEDEILSTLLTIQPSSNPACSATQPADPITSILGVSVLIEGTIVVYDHSEPDTTTATPQPRTYEPDISAPTRTGENANTEIWGDADCSNGFNPNLASCTPGVDDANDFFAAGTYIQLSNTVVSTEQDWGGPTGGPHLYDAADKMGSDKPLSITRITWASGSNTLFGGGHEVYDTSQYGLLYDFPVGEDLGGEFEYTGASIMAAEDGTLIDVDLNGNGILTDPGDQDDFLLDQGESYQINGGIQSNGRITAGKPVQVDLIVGAICGNFRSRFITLFPVDGWSDRYYTPVDTPFANLDGGAVTSTLVFLFNPSDTSAITVQVRRTDGAGGIDTTDTVNVPANSSVSYAMPARTVAALTGTGASFSSDGNPFYAVSTVGTAHDWGFTLVPEGFLSQQTFVGTGLGKDPTSATVQNGSPVWLTASRLDRMIPDGGKIDVCVDYNGDNAGPLTFGTRNYDVDIAFDIFQNYKVFDPDGDQSSLLAFICDTDVGDANQAVIAAAWGEDAESASNGSPGLDMGTGVPNVKNLLTDKTSAFLIDNNMDGLANVGDIIEYTIDITNNGFVPISTLDILVQVQDNIPPDMMYVPNTTCYFDDSTAGPGPTPPLNLANCTTGDPLVWDQVPDDPGPSSPFPLDMDSPGMGVLLSDVTNDPVSVNETVTFRYQARVITVPFAPDQICNIATSSRDAEQTDDINCLDGGPTSISGIVESDTTGDTIGDTPLAGVVVQLFTDPNGDGDPSDGVLVSSTTTAADGSYLFDNLVVSAAGDDFVVVEVDPANHTSVSDVDASPNDGYVAPSLPVDDAANISITYSLITVHVKNGESDSENNFVDSPTARITGLVWLDEDQDGINDIEEGGLTNITVELQDGVCTPLPGPGEDCPTVITDQFGNYVFDDVPPGNYSIVVDPTTLPPNLSNTAGPFGLTSRPVALSPGQESSNQNFGYIANPGTGIIGDRVWSDANGNGIQDAGEAGIAGVTVELFDGSGVSQGTTTTDSDGDYFFTNVPFGDDYT